MARPDLRRLLLLGTALAAAPAAALPGAPGSIATNTGGGAPVLTNPVAGTLDVKLNAARTVLQYSNFAINTGETVNFRFDNRSDLAVVHATQSAITVDGTLNSFVGAAYGGNVWLLSAAGVFFGAGAHVDVGGLVASTSIPSDLLNIQGGINAASNVLKPSVLSFDFGNGGGLVSIAGGAQITGHGGTLAFIAPSVTTGKNAVIGGAGDTSVLYGAAQRYTVRFVQEAGNDLDLLDFEVPGLTAGTLSSTPLTLAGTTSAGNVYVAAVNRADAVRAVLDAQGAIGATSAGAEGGTIVLTSGGGIANRAAAPLFGDGTYRQDLQTGQLDASRNISATATGNINFGGPVTAGGSIVAKGVNVFAGEMTAGQDIIVRTGDAAGSSGPGTPGSGYGYGYGGYGTPAYGKEGGNFYADLVNAGDDIAVEAFGGSIDIGKIVLAGTGPDAAGDPLGLLDSANDGRRLSLRTYGDDDVSGSDIYLGYHQGYSGISGGTSLVVTSGRDVFVSETGDVTLTSITASGTINAFADGALTVGSLSGRGVVAAGAGGAVDIGSATTTLDGRGNGQIALEGGTSARLGTGNAATDIIVVADNGNATVGTANAGDDLIVRAFAGDVSVGSAFVGVGGEAPDTDGNRVDDGEGYYTLFSNITLDQNDNGRVIDLAASRTARVIGGGEGGGDQFRTALAPDPTGGNVSLGLGTGNIGGATFVTLNGEGNVIVDLVGDAGIDQIQAGGSASLTSRTGDAYVDNATTGLDLGIFASLGDAGFGTANVGQDFTLSGKTVSFGNLYGNDALAPRDVTILTSDGDFSASYVNATRDLTLDIHGNIDVGGADAGNNLFARATGAVTFGGSNDEDFAKAFTQVSAGQDLTIIGATITFLNGTPAIAGRDLTLTTTAGDLNLDAVDLEAGRDVIATSSGALTAGDASAVRDLILTGASVDVQSLTAGRDGKVTATVTDAHVGDAATKRDLSIVAANGLAQVGDAHVGQDFLLSGKQVSLGSLGPYTETSGYGYGGYGYGYGGYGTTVYPTRDVTIIATAGDFDATNIITLDAGRDLTIDVSGELDAGSLTAGRNLTLTGGSVFVAGTATAGEDARVTARTDDLFVDTIVAGDDATVTGSAFGLVDAERITTTGAGPDAEGTGANIGITGFSVSVAEIAAAGNVNIETVDTAVFGYGPAGATSGLDFTVRAAALDFGTVTAGRDLRLTATDGGLVVGGPDSIASSGRDVIITSTELIQNVRFSAVRDLVLTGAGIDADFAEAGRDVTATATAGNIRIGSALAGDDIRLTATPGSEGAGDIAVRSARTTAATGDFADTEGDGSNIVATGHDIRFGLAVAPTDIRLTGTGMVTLGVADPDSEDDAYAEAGNDIVVVGTALLTGPLDAGRDVTLTATAGGIEGRGTIFAGRNVTTAATGATTYAGDITGNAVSLGGGSIVAAGVDGETGVTATGGSVTIARLSTRGDATVTATTGDARVDDANVKNDLTVLADAGLARVGDARVGHDLLLRGQSVFLGSLDGYTESNGYGGYGGYGYGYGSTFTRTHDATLTALGGDISGGATLIVTNDILATATGAITLGDLDAGNDVRATAGLALVTGDVTAGRDALLSGGSLDTGAIDAGRDVSLTATASGIAAGTIGAVRDLTLNAAQALTFADATAGRDLRLTGNSIDGGTATAGRDLTASAATSLTLQSAVAADDVRLSGATIDVDVARATGLGEDTEGDGSNVVATGGAMTLEQVVAATDISVTGTGPVIVGIAGSGEAVGTAGDYYAQAGNDIVLTGATLLTGPLDAGRDVRLTATAGGIDARGAIDAGRDVTAGATGLAQFAASIRAGRDIGVTAGSIDAATATALNDVILTATSGDAVLGSGTAKRDLTVLALLGLAQVGDAHVGRDLLMRGGRVVLGSLDGYTETSGYGGYGYGYGYGQGQTTFTLTRDATLDAVISDISGPSLTVARDIHATAVRDITLGDLNAGNDVLVSAGRALVVGDAVAGRDIVFSGGTLGTGSLNAGRDLSLTATGGSIASGGSLSAVRDLTVDGVGVTLGTATAGRDLTLNSRTGTLTLTSGTAGDDARLSGATQSLGQVRATGLGMDSEGDGSNVVLTGGQITAAQLQAVTDINVTGTDAVSIGQAAAGRDVTVSGGTVGGALQLSGRDVTVTSGGAFTAPSGLVAARDLRLTAGTTLSFANLTAARDLFLTASTVAGGSATATRDLTVVATTAITGTLYQAGRDLVLDPNEAINVGTARATGNATLIGASVIVGTLDVGGTTSVLATAGGISLDTFRSVGGATLIATGKVDLGDSTTPALRIVGGDLDVRRSLVASSLQVETPGKLTLGGTAAQGETGFRLAGADIARLRVTGVASFYAGLTSDAQAPAGDLIVQDFAYNPANLPRLALFADRNHIVDVQGIVAPSDVGGALQIGDASPTGRFRPSSIFVSGGLGTAELIANCFGKLVPANSLSLYAVNDVIFGDTGFRSAVQATAAGAIDIFAGVPATPPRTDDRLFAVTTRLIVQAGGKVVSQNSASAPGAYVGIVLIGTGATGPIVDIGNAAAADLSGSIIDSNGLLRSGPLVARAAELGPGGVNGAIFRFNGCIVGGGDCATANGGTPSQSLRIEDFQPPRPVDLTDSPLTTVLIADNTVGKTSPLTVVNESGGIVLRPTITVLDAGPDTPGSTPGSTPPPGTPGATPETGPETPAPGCNAVPGSNSSEPDCPVGNGPK